MELNDNRIMVLIQAQARQSYVRIKTYLGFD